jgi:hypothetical protein
MGDRASFGPLRKMAASFRETDAPEGLPRHFTQAGPDSSGAVQLQPGRVVNFSDREGSLRWLARTQNINGSWNDDVEQTAVGLLAFVRAGETPRTGTFRQALRRAVRWLMDHNGEGFACFVRALAFEELSAATGLNADRQAAELARLNLPLPANDLESAALSKPVSPVGAIQTLDDLRLAALQGLHLRVPPALAEGNNANLVQVWSTLL